MGYQFTNIRYIAVQNGIYLQSCCNPRTYRFVVRYVKQQHMLLFNHAMFNIA